MGERKLIDRARLLFLAFITSWSISFAQGGMTLTTESKLLNITLPGKTMRVNLSSNQTAAQWIKSVKDFVYKNWDTTCVATEVLFWYKSDNGDVFDIWKRVVLIARLYHWEYDEVRSSQKSILAAFLADQSLNQDIVAVAQFVNSGLQLALCRTAKPISQ